MAVSRTISGKTHFDQRLTAAPTAGRRALAVAATVVIAGLIVSSESFAPLPMAIIACVLVAAGFLTGAYAWFRGIAMDQAQPTAWDYSGLFLFAGFALATALGSGWMTP